MNPSEKQLGKNDEIEKRVEAILSQMTMQEKVSLLSGKDLWRTVPVERLGVPSIVMTDGPHGVRACLDDGRRAEPTTTFPTGVSIAATWNPSLIEKVGEALGEETKALGCHILLGPCVNIVRHPLAGRNFESYSEDPCLAGKIGAAWVRGIQSKGVGASLKHYACNNQETERGRGNSIVDERALREIYLAQFETVVKESNPWTVMCSYNRINGEYASQNRHLLTEILKGEWGYDGAVISDWGANHTVVDSVANGLDLEMPGPAKYYGTILLESEFNWQIETSAIDEAARRMLRLILRASRADLSSGSFNTPAHQTLASSVAAEAITLLKNENVILPLNLEKVKTIAIIGAQAAVAAIGGGGSSFVVPPYEIAPLAALRTKLGQKAEIAYSLGSESFGDVPAISTEYVVPGPNGQHGMWGEYFDNPDFSGAPVMKRTDTRMGFWWWGRGPSPEVGPNFSVRWTGKISVPKTGNYSMGILNTGVARLFLDDELIVESVANNLEVELITKRKTVERELKAGKTYSLKLEFIKPEPDWCAQVTLLFAFTPPQDSDDRIAQAVAIARQADAAIVFAGFPEGFETEGADRAHMDLPNRQAELIREVAKANKNTIVVLNTGAPVTMPWLEDVPAVVEAYYAGLEGGNAIAQVLTGEVNPSGKLPVTFPKRLEDTPAFNNFPGKRSVIYGESIFVGYRHYDTRDVEPLFPFGHGLSYTTFEYGDLQVPKEVRAGARFQVSIKVKNTGKRAGKETVQLYLRDSQSSLQRPQKELKAFHKVDLKPGESQTITFDLNERDLSFYHPDLRKWVAEPGSFEVLAGSSSRDIRARAQFQLLAG